MPRPARAFAFTGSSGLQVPLNDPDDPLEVFEQFVDDAMIAIGWCTHFWSKYTGQGGTRQPCKLRHELRHELSRELERGVAARVGRGIAQLKK